MKLTIIAKKQNKKKYNTVSGKYIKKTKQDNEEECNQELL